MALVAGEIAGGHAHVEAHGGAQQLTANAGHFRSELGGFAVAATRDVVMVEHADPILLGPEAAGALAEEQQPVGPARDARPGKAAQFAGFGIVQKVVALAAGAGLVSARPAKEPPNTTGLFARLGSLAASMP